MKRHTVTRMTRLTDSASGALSACFLLLVSACGERPAAWDAGFSPGNDASGAKQIVGLTGSVAVLDPGLNQLMMLTSPRPLELSTTRLPVGRDVVKFATSPGRDQLFVLSRGVQPQLRSSDEAPQLRVFDGGIAPQQLEQYKLQDPYEQLEVDPQGEWLIVHGSEGLVSNPNELLLLRLGQNNPSDSELPSKTLDSYGGKPIRFTFTSELSVPGAEARRLLVVQREKDLAVIDLADLNAPEITVPLPANGSGGYTSPVAVAYHEGVADEVGAMLAVQLAGDSNVFLLTLGRGNDEHALTLEANLVDVGGVPSTIDFVQTKKGGGLRLAALVPSRSAAMLIEPGTGTVQEVKLPQPFDKIRRITGDVADGSGDEIALLYGKTNTIAFWRLGATTGTPYRSIDAYDISISVDNVLDIPGAEFADRKILAGGTTGPGRQFYVLDLSERKSFPLDALRNLTLNLSPDGQRLWAFEPGATGFAQLTFEPLQPSSLYSQEPIDFVHDFATQRSEAERSAMTLHVLPQNGGHTLAATLFDGLSPSSAHTKFYDAIELEGIE
ncbi:MAG TPA: hypothetical protein VEX18_17420 [Polyangiaceae bacterium]|nr:hypothetical protein [Polyangiaceae bacterium]